MSLMLAKVRCCSMQMFCISHCSALRQSSAGARLRGEGGETAVCLRTTSAGNLLMDIIEFLFSLYCLSG